MVVVGEEDEVDEAVQCNLHKEVGFSLEEDLLPALHQKQLDIHSNNLVYLFVTIT
jgi:hypothetical protein